MTSGDEPDIRDALCDGLGEHKVIVLGDLILDHYLSGSATRLSPEAPVPVIRPDSETYMLGGAANVASALSRLGLDVVACGVVGLDSAGDRLLSAFQSQGISTHAVERMRDRPTTHKTRVLVGHNQVTRIDREERSDIDADIQRKLRVAIDQQIEGAAALIVSDYAMGTVPASLCAWAIRRGRELGIPVLVDPKCDSFARYAEASLVTPNALELSRVLGVGSHDLPSMFAAGKALSQRLGFGAILLTLSDQGAAWICDDGVHHSRTVPRRVFDVCGAGDTALAAATVATIVGLAPLEFLQFVNCVAGLTVDRLGAQGPSCEEVLAALSPHTVRHEQKLCSQAEVVALTERWRHEGEQVVFTNGCFDLFHAGHVQLLLAAADQGSRLIVAINSDRSVRRLKQAGRPFIEQRDRQSVIAAIDAVDAVVVFDDDSPLDLISRLRPNVLVKGADYDLEDIVGADEVRSTGGRVHRVPLVEGQSSTGVAQKVVNSAGSGKWAGK